MNGEASLTAASTQSPSSVVADANVSLGGVNFPQLILNALHGYGKVKAQSMENDNDVRERQAQISDEDLYNLPANAGEMLSQFSAYDTHYHLFFHLPTVQPADSKRH